MNQIILNWMCNTRAQREFEIVRFSNLFQDPSCQDEEIPKTRPFPGKCLAVIITFFVEGHTTCPAYDTFWPVFRVDIRKSFSSVNTLVY